MIYLSLVPKAFGHLSSLVGCSDAVSTWFLKNALLLNPEDRGDHLWHASAAGWHTESQTSAGVSVAGTVVHFAEAVKLLGVSKLDSALTFNQHVTNVVRACTYHTRTLRHIRPLLTIDTAKLIAASIVGARLDYCNSLLYGTSEGNLDRLQRVQNQLARVVLQAPWTASATDMRRQLHWLPVRQRIVFKLATVTYIRHGCLDCRCTYSAKFTITIRLELFTQLQQQPATISSAATAFCAAAPTVWNSLGVHTRSCDTFLTFKNRLKTELLKSCYS